jgi:hypothetical protein
MAQKIVCYGDLVTFEWGQKQGYLGSQSEFQASNSLYSSLKLSTHQFELVTLLRADGHLNQNFDEEILAGCIFQVITDDGKDFDGVPVKYGSEINFRLRRSGHRMHTVSDGQDSIDLGAKTFGFRFNPKYKFNAERQYVVYEDLIVITEHGGKHLYVEHSRDSRKVSFASNHRSTPFRIHFFGVECKANERDEKVLMYSDIVQFYHIEAGGFAASERHSSNSSSGPALAVHAGVGRDPLSHDKVSAEGIVAHIKQKSSKQYEASTLWQIESNVGHDKEVPSGKLKSNSELRLRHVLTDTYLNVTVKRKTDAVKKSTSTEVQLDLKSDPLDSTIFFCDVLPHGSFESISSSLGSSGSVELMSNHNVRICNIQSASFVATNLNKHEHLDQELNDFVPLVATQNDFDGDIFRVSSVPPNVVQDVFVLKVFSRALTKQLMEMEKNPGNPENVSRAVQLLMKLMQKDQGGVLLDRNFEKDVTIANSRQQSAIDIGFVTLFLRIANTVGTLSDARKQFTEVEVELVKTTYIALERLVYGNVDAVRAVVDMRGIHQMIVHLGYFGKRGVIPPIAECITVILNPSRASQLAQFITKHDIKLLFDQVYESLLAGEVPLIAQYDILCLLCTSDDWVDRNGSSLPYAEEQRQIRLWVCEMLLGKYYAGFSRADRIGDFEPRHSIMIYPTQLNARGDLLIATSIYGQQRPTYFPAPGAAHPIEIFDPQRPPEFESLYQNPNDWRELVAEYRKSIDSAVNTIADENRKREHPHVAALHGFVEWKPIFSLTHEEARFYKSTLRLISSLCLARNFPCQSRVRKLLPVDHVLYIMDSGSKVLAKHHESPTKKTVASTFQSLFISPRNDQKTAHGKELAVTEIDIEKECELNVLRSIFNSILCGCYLNSAVLPPMNDSLSHGQARAEKYVTETWDNLFLDECYNKVFSLMSQEDIEFIDISKSMAAVELLVMFAHSVYFLSTPFASDYRYTQPPAALTALIETTTMPVNKLHAPVTKAVLETQSSFASMLPPLSGLTEEVLWDRISRMNPAMVDELFNFLLLHRQERKKHISRRGFASLIQRARLRRFMIDWIEQDAAKTWTDKIMRPVHRINMLRAGVKGIDRPNERILVTQIDYFMSILRLLRDSMTRKFFDVDYNNNPIYHAADNGESSPAVEKSQGRRPPQTFSFYDIDLHEEEAINQGCHFADVVVGTLDGESSKTAKVLVKEGSSRRRDHDNTYADSTLAAIHLIAKKMIEILSSSSEAEEASLNIHDERQAYKYFAYEYGVVDKTVVKKGHGSQAKFEPAANYFEKCAAVKILCAEILVMSLENAHANGMELLWNAFTKEFSTFSTSPNPYRLVAVASTSANEVEDFDMSDEDGLAMTATRKVGKLMVEIPEDGRSRFKFSAAVKVAARISNYPTFCFTLPNFFASIYDHMRTMLNLLNFNNDKLSYLVLQLLYLMGTRRTSLVENIRSMFSDPTVRLHAEHGYLLRQRTLLSIVLEKFEASGFSSTAESALSVRNFVHNYRNIIFNSDASLAAIGLIHFCSGSNIEEGMDQAAVPGGGSKTVQDVLHASLANIKKVNEENDPGIVEVSIGGKSKSKAGDVPRTLLLKRHSAVNKVKTTYEIVADESLDDVRLALDLLKFPMNRLRQKILRQYQFHEVIMGFFRSQAENIIAEAETRSQIPAISLLSQDLNTIFALNIFFLRAFCHENSTNAEALSTRANVALLLQLRNCHTEVVNLLCDIFRSRKDQADELLVESNILDLVKDVFISDAGNAKANKKSSNSTLLLESVLSSNSSGRIFDIIVSYFNRFISKDEMTIMLANLAGAPYRMKDGAPSGYSSSQYISQICDAFGRETGLPTLIRDAPFSLAPQHEEEVFSALVGEMKNWKFLSSSSFLQVQLRLVSCMATLCRRSSLILQQCRKFFGSVVTLLSFLSIDKFELRGPYLTLFHSMWFNFASPDAVSMDFDQYRKLVEILFCWLQRDVRKYMYFSRLVDTLDRTSLKYFLSLEDYIISSLIPFLQKFLCSTVYVSGKKDVMTQLELDGSLTLSGPLRMKLSTAAFNTVNSIYNNLVTIVRGDDRQVRSSPRLYQAVTSCLKQLSAVPTDKFNPILATLFKDVVRTDELHSMVIMRLHSSDDHQHQRLSASGSHDSLSKHGNIQVHGNDGHAHEFMNQCIELFIPIAIQLFEDASTGTFYYQNTSSHYYKKQHTSEKQLRALLENKIASAAVQESLCNSKDSLTFSFCKQEMSRIIYRYEANKTANRFKASDTADIFDGSKFLEELENVEEVFRSFLPVSYRHNTRLEKFNGFFDRWNLYGSKLVERIFELVDNSIETGAFMAHMKNSRSSGSGYARASLLLGCNMYWIDAFIEGILHDKLGDMTIEEQNADERIKDVESERLQFSQCQVMQLGGTDCVMTMMRQWDFLVPHFLDSVVEVHEKQRFAETILTKGIELGIAMMQYGNEEVQNNMTENAVSDLTAHKDYKISSHFLITVGDSLHQFRKQLSRVKSRKDGHSHDNDDALYQRLNRMLRFLTLYTEGHNSRTQNFVRSQGDLISMDLVSEVCNVVEDISKAVTDKFKAMYYMEDELPPKYQPSIYNGRSFPVICWERGRRNSYFGKESIFHHETGPEIKRLCSMLNEAILTLCEFCQGPCVDNQKAVAKSRAFNYINDLFQFFGSFQFCGRLSQLDEPLEPLPTSEGQSQSSYYSFSGDSNKAETEPQWQSRFVSTFQKLTTHEGVYDHLTSPLWCGFDPLSTMMMVNRQNKLGYVPDDSDWGKSGMLGRMLKYKSKSAQISPKGDDNTAFREWSDMMTRFYIAKREYIEWKSSKASSESIAPPMHILANEYYQIFELGNMLADLERSCMTLINGVLEGADQSSNEVTQLLIRGLRVPTLIGNMANYWDRYLCHLQSKSILFSASSSGNNNRYCYEANGAFAYYGLVMRFKDLSVSEELDSKLASWLEESGIQVNDHMARIEVLGNVKDAVDVVYFPIPAIVRKFWMYDLIVDGKKGILFPDEAARRDTIEEKVIDFLRRGDDLKAVLRHYQFMDEFTRRNPWFYMFSFVARFNNVWVTLQFLVAMAINCMLFLYAENLTPNVRLNPLEDDTFLKKSDENLVFTILELSMCGAALMGLLSDLLLKGWLAVEIGFETNSENTFEFNKRTSPILYTICRILFYSCVFRFIVVNVETSPSGKVKVQMGSIVMALYYYFTNPSTAYAWIMLACSVMGLFLDPLCFVGCMTEVLRISDLMRYVARSFTENADQLLAAVGLGAIIIYVFVAISLTTFHPTWFERNFNGFGGCTTLNECTRLHFDYGIMNTPNFNDPHGHGYIQNIGVEFYNFCYVFIVNIVLPGMVSGIIIDTFSELRGQKMAIYDDVVNNCFICGIKREDFEAASIDFAEHTKNDHNMWKYLWYQEYLRDKEVSEFTGGEQFVSEMLKNADTRYKWLPLKKARALQKASDRYDNYSIYRKLEALSEKVSKMDDVIQAQFTALSASQAKSDDGNDAGGGTGTGAGAGPAGNNTGREQTNA